MRKKIPFKPLAQSVLLSLLMAGACLADAAALLEQAQTYVNDGAYEQAEALYQQVLAQRPGTDHALQAQKGLAILYIAWGKQPEADAAFEELQADYSGHPDFSGAVCLIGDNYRWRGADEKARQMYEIAVEGASGAGAFWPKMGLAITSIRLKDYETGDPLTVQILLDFTDDDRLPIAACRIADAYRSVRHHRQATDLYRYVVENHPESEYAMWSQMGIAICNIDLGNHDAAESAVEELRTNHADHPSFYKAVGDIGDNYRWRNIHDKAREMYQIAIEGISGPEAFWVKAGLAIASAHVRDYETAEPLTEQIQSEFADHAQLPEAICLIAGAYNSIGDYEKALGLYQHILETWPRNEQALWTGAGMARIAIALGDEDTAAEAIDRMKADFSDHQALPAALWAIEEEYYDLAFQHKNRGLDDRAGDYFAKVISTGQEILNQWPDSAPGGEICYISAICGERLGDYARAIEYFEKVVADWPDYERAWNAQYLIAHNYESLMGPEDYLDAGIVAQIKGAYEQVTLKYPDCPAANAARNWIEINKNLIDLTEGGQK